MPNVESRLIVTVDTESDKLPNWRTATPLSFRAVTESIPYRLQPLFSRYGIRPTYLLSPEVITHPESVAMLRALRDVELTTHLHGDYVVPQIKTWDFAGSLTDEMQLEYGHDLELAKMAVLTELFRQQFGYQPLSFRAGRFGAGPHTGGILQKLGYQVDSSVTPHICWTSRHGKRIPDYRGYPEMPYTLGPEGNIAVPGHGGLLELPVSVLPVGAVLANNAAEPIWFRPWYSDADTLCRVFDYVLAQPPVNGVHRPLVMMFHNVELLAGASPYPQSEHEVQRYLDALARVFNLAEQRGLQSNTMAEYATYYAADKTTQAQSVENKATSVGRDGLKLGRANDSRGLPLNLGAELRISPEIIDTALANHGAPPWFQYIYKHRTERWDVMNPCRWIADNIDPASPILSIGAGVGFNLFWLAERGFTDLHGSDIDPKAIAAGSEIAQRTGLPVSLSVRDALAPVPTGGAKYAVIEALNWTMLLGGFKLKQFLDIYVPQLAQNGVLIIDAIDASYSDVPDNEYLTSDMGKPVMARRPSEYLVRLPESEVRAEFASHGLSVVEMWQGTERVPRKVYLGRLVSAQSADAPAIGSQAIALQRPRMLIVADVPNWIFDRHAHKLKTDLLGTFDSDIVYSGQPFDEDHYDLIHSLEWNLVPLDQIKTPAKWITGIRSHITWERLDFDLFCGVLREKFGSVYVVSRRLLDIFVPWVPGVRLLAHGVDVDHFRTVATPGLEAGRLRVGWAGNRKSSAKGFETFVEPLGRIHGVDLIFCGYSDRLVSLDEMPAFYESIDTYVCSSSSEGHNNSLMEAAAMGRSIVTTDVGTVPEYLVHGQSALIVPRDPVSISEAVIRLRDDPTLRQQLGAAARAAVLANFDWKDRMHDHRVALLRALSIATKYFSRRPSAVDPVPAVDTEQANSSTRELALGTALHHHQTGQLEQADAIYLKLLGLNGDDFVALHLHGVVLHQQGNFSLAKEYLLKALAINSVTPAAHHNLGNVYMSLGRADQARVCFTKAITLDPTFQLAHTQLAVLNKVSN
jgi:glycosyltransferase involved in cell wall biosynthesis